MSIISQYVLILGLQSTLVALVACAAMQLVRKSSVSVHAIGIACTLLLLASPVLVAVLPFDGVIASAFTERPVTLQAADRVTIPNTLEAPVIIEPSRKSATEVDAADLANEPATVFNEPAMASAEPVFDEAESRPSTIADAAIQPSKPVSIIEKASSPLHWSDLPMLLGLIWIVGAACLVAARVRSYLRLRSAVRGAHRVGLDPMLVNHLSKVFGEKGRVDLRVCETISVPFVLGILKPRIYVPSYVWNSPQHRQDVLTHEIAHIVRHDHWYHLAQRIVSILYWWQPIVHTINRRISDAREAIADNYVLRGSDGSSYASTLLAVAEHCVGIRSPENALAFLAQEPALEQRVQSILDESRSLQVSSTVPMRVTIAMIALVLISMGGGIGTTTFSLLAQEEFPKQRQDTSSEVRSNDAKANSAEANETANALESQTPLSVSGRVLDAGGNAVAECLLVVRVYDGNGAERILSTRSDAQGKYSLSLPPIIHLRSHEGWAYKEGYNMRTVFFAIPLRKSKHVTGLDITLPDQEKTEITIVAPDGKPAPDVVVRPDIYWVPMSQFADIPEDPSRVSSQIPEEIINKIQVVTNAEGKATLVGLSPNLVFRFHAVTKDYGEQEFALDFLQRLRQSETFSLSSTRTVRGVLAANNPSRFKGMFIELRSRGGVAQQRRPFGPQRSGQNLRLNPIGGGYAKVEIDANGEFQVPAMAIGEVTPSYKLWGADSIVVPVLNSKQPQFPDLKSLQEELKLEFSLMRTVQVQGRLLKADTKEPIPNVCVSAYNKNVEIGAQTSTDAEGKFSVRVVPGSVQYQAFYLASRFENYDLPADFTINVDPSEESMQVSDLLAEPWPHWIVHLNNTDGSPMVHQHIALTYPGENQARIIYIRGKSDASGNADLRMSQKVIPAIDEGSFLFYRINAADAEGVEPNGSLKVARRTENEIWLVPASGE